VTTGPESLETLRIPARGLAVTLALAALLLLAAPARATTITPDTLLPDIPDNSVNGNCTLREAVISANTDTSEDACAAGADADQIMLQPGTYQLFGILAQPLFLTDDVTITGHADGSTVHMTPNPFPGADSDAVFTLPGPDFGSGGTTATLERLTIAGGDDGVVVGATETLNLIDATIAGNDTGVLLGGGGPTGPYATVSITNSTVSDNRVVGIWVQDSGIATLRYSTVADNSMPCADYVTCTGVYNAGSVTLKGTIIADNPGGDCFAVRPFASQGHNLLEGPRCDIEGMAGDVIGLDPALGPLAENGGPTKTHALLSRSPALGAADHIRLPRHRPARRFPSAGAGSGHRGLRGSVFERV
jgi:parallel beta-helix repeat protein